MNSPEAFWAAWRSTRGRLTKVVEEQLLRQEELVASLLSKAFAETEVYIPGQLVSEGWPPTDRTHSPPPKCMRTQEPEDFEDTLIRPPSPLFEESNLATIVPCGPNDVDPGLGPSLSFEPRSSTSARSTESEIARPVVRSRRGSHSSDMAPKRSKTMQKFLEADLEEHVEASSAPGPGERITSVLKSCIEAWDNLEEPKREGMLHSLVSSRYFETFITLAIMANIVYTAYQANWEIRNLGGKPPGDTLVEGTFATIFLLELMGKLFVHRCYFFVNDDMGWNIFDLALVMFSFSDWMISVLVGNKMPNVNFMRAVRVLKIAKVLRIFRAIRFLKELRIMVVSIMGSLCSLGWSIIMLGVILFVFALFFVQQMTVYLIDNPDPVDPSFQQDQVNYFGDVLTTIGSLAMCTTGGKDWEEIELLIRPLGSFCTFVFAFYLAFYTIAVMNILTGLFVERAMAVCQPDEAEKFLEAKKSSMQTRQELELILETIDVNGDDRMEVHEFAAAVSNEKTKHALNSLGFDFKDTELAFRTVASVTGEDKIPIPMLVDELMRLKGQASSLELLGMAVKIDMLQELMQKFFKDFEAADLR